MISKRKLLKYRKEALQFKEDIKHIPEGAPTNIQLARLLELTQELIDQHLLKEQ